MPAAAFAAKSPFQMVFPGKNHQPGFIDIIVFSFF